MVEYELNLKTSIVLYSSSNTPLYYIHIPQYSKLKNYDSSKTAQYSKLKNYDRSKTVKYLSINLVNDKANVSDAEKNYLINGATQLGIHQYDKFKT